MTITKSQRFQIPPVLLSVFEKLRSSDGLVWTLGRTGQIQNKAAFSNFSVDILVQTWKSGHELDWAQNQKLM